MRLFVCRNYEELSHKAACAVASVLRAKPDCVLGLATGSTPLGLYANLIEDYRKGELDFSKTRTVNLDEYKGLGPEDPQSYRYFMQENLFSKVNIDPKRTFVPDGLKANGQEACREIENVLKCLGQIDLQILGIGENGHIGFNEPDDFFPVEAHEVELTASTIAANARFFDDETKVPGKAYSMGIGDIMSAKKILLLANGVKKAEAVAAAFNGRVDPKVPASILQLHPDVEVYADLDAAALFR